jgi:hypothetical protein
LIDIIIVDSCLTASPTSISTQSLNYVLNSPALVTLLPAYTISPNYCTPFTHQIVNFADGLAINPTYFTYNSALNLLTVLVSVDPLFIGPWSFKVTANLIKDSYTYFTLNYQVNLNVDGGCVVTIITPGIMPG